MSKSADAQPQTAMVPTDDVPEFVGLANASTEEIGNLIRENLGNEFSLFDFPEVKIPAGGGTAWEMPSLEGVQYMNAFEGVIIMAQEHRVFYLYDTGENAGVPPDCSSKDGLVAEPNSDPGGFCEQCPKATWGSALNKDGSKGKGQACKLRKQLVILRPNEFFPLMVDLPPATLGNFRKYMVTLTSAGKVSTQVITEIGLEKAKSAGGLDYSKATFRMSGLLDTETAARAVKYSETIRMMVKLQDLEADVEAATSSEARTELSHVPANAAAPATADSDDPFGGN